MKKIIVSKLFLYRYRFVIGYALLGFAYLGMLLSLPIIGQYGLSDAEMASAESSYYLNIDAPFNGDLVDLPYRLLQKFSIKIFGLTPYAVVLPSIIIGILLGLLLVLLLNRWFKSNVSLLASCMIVLSTPFLFLAGFGTPLIMLVFWPTLLLWLGSKIQGEKRPKPMYSFWFAIALLGAIFTPYMLYFALFCILFVAFQPHLRYIVKSLPKLPLFIVGIIIVGGVTALIMNVINHPSVIQELLFNEGFSIDKFIPNVLDGLKLCFSWWGTVESTLLAPLVSLPIFALALTGLFSTTKGFFASRNSIASLMLLFSIIIMGFNPEAAIFIVLPTSILVAHGLKYVFEKWYGLFPENPYARIAALIPLTLLFGIMAVPSSLQYFYGYRYNPEVATKFDDTLKIIRRNLKNQTLTDQTLVVGDKHYRFYRILEDSTELKVSESIPDNNTNSIAIMTRQPAGEKYQLSRIITSPRKENSDIIYLYTVKGE